LPNTSTGLFLSCRQLNRELTKEGVRQPRVLLDEVSKARSQRDGWREKEEAEAYGELGGHCYLVSAEPKTVAKTLFICVKVPFMLPEFSYDWYHQHYPPRSPCTPRRLSEFDRDCEQQERAYKIQLRRLLESVKRLHGRYASGLNVELVADEATRTRIARDSQFFEDLDKYRRYPGALRNTAFGRLLNFYVQSLGDQAGRAMMDTSGDWGFNTITVKVAWDFGSDLTDVSAEDLQRYSCCNFFHIQ
jgi:hypothetical protein